MTKQALLMAALGCFSLFAGAQSTTFYKCGTTSGITLSQTPCNAGAVSGKATISGYAVPSNPYSGPKPDLSSKRVVSGKVLSEEGVPLQDLQSDTAPKPLTQGVRAPS